MPLKMYFRHGKIKVEIGLATGEKAVRQAAGHGSESGEARFGAADQRTAV